MKLKKEEKLLGVFLLGFFNAAPLIAAWAMVSSENPDSDLAWNVITAASMVVMLCFLVSARKSILTYAMLIVQSRAFALFAVMGVVMLAALAKVGLESIVSGNIPYGAAALLTYAIAASFGAGILYFCFLGENDKL